MADKYLVTDQKLLNKTNEENNTSSKFLRSLDTIAVYITEQSTRRQKVFSKKNMALAIPNKFNSFTFIAKDESSLLDIQTIDGETMNQTSLGSFLCHYLFLEVRIPKCILTYIDLVYCFHKMSQYKVL